MRIAILAAGAGGMICGSCLRENALARALKRLGHEVVLVPLYTPLRVEGERAGVEQVFYGGVNVYLQHASGVFRRTPRAFDWLLDRPWLLKWAGSKGAATAPADVAELTVSILRGEAGSVAKELHRLVRFLKEEVRPEIVTLPNLMFIGAARTLRAELGAAVVCELTGEDIFLEALGPADQVRTRRIIRSQVGHVSRFVATSRYYARKMAGYLDVAEDRIEVVYPGVAREMRIGAAVPGARPPSVGYMARICPEKGLGRLVDALSLLCRKPGLERVRLRAGGYLSPAHRIWFAELRKRIAAEGLQSNFEYLGEVSAEEKLNLLWLSDVFSVPSAFPEPKGIYVLEALATATPVVLPAHGAFEELIEQTGGGLLVPPGDAPALAEALAELLLDPAKRLALGRRGCDAVGSAFTEDHMAAKMAQVFEGARA